MKKVLGAVLFSAAVGTCGQTAPAAPPAASRGTLQEFSHSIRALTARVSPAVVQILVNGYGSAEEEVGRSVSTVARQRSTGSGVILSPDGYILTNAHVVRGAVRVRVLLGATSSQKAVPPVEARIIGLDRDTDLALIKVDRTGLTSLRFADSDSLRQGDLVLAVGSPFGLQNSVSFGVVSSPSRALDDANPMVYIQTDASINPGNSGGALVNAEGSLVGINSFILTQSGGSEGVGFAIPSSIARSVYRQLKLRGHVHRGEIGVSVQTITPVLAEGLSLPRQQGVIVADVEPEGPAEVAGLRQGDIVLSFNGRDLADARQFEVGLWRMQRTDKVRLEVLRGTSHLTIAPAVRERESKDDPLADLASPEKHLIARLGILCIEIDKRVVQLIAGLRSQYGLIVAAKSPQGQAQYVDIQSGDVIHALNGLAMSSVEVFRKSIDELKPGSPVVLQVEREGRFQFLSFELE
jgi:serine protease Do